MELIEEFSEKVVHVYSSSKNQVQLQGKKTFKISNLVFYTSVCMYIYSFYARINNFCNKYFFYHVAVN